MTRRISISTDAFILRTRETRESEELSRLAPAAVRVIESRGRVRPEPPDHYRTAFERDRDRKLQCCDKNLLHEPKRSFQILTER